VKGVIPSKKVTSKTNILQTNTNRETSISSHHNRISAQQQQQQKSAPNQHTHHQQQEQRKASGQKPRETARQAKEKPITYQLHHPANKQSRKVPK